MSLKIIMKYYGNHNNYGSHKKFNMKLIKI